MQDSNRVNPSQIRWESSHVCPRCSLALNLADFDLRTITTGIVVCPKCDWSGPIEIRIVDGDAPQT
jgi:ribosomal protein L37AE/L43A